MRISDWSSDVCSSDLGCPFVHMPRTDRTALNEHLEERWRGSWRPEKKDKSPAQRALGKKVYKPEAGSVFRYAQRGNHFRSEERRVGKECDSTFRYRGSHDH